MMKHSFRAVSRFTLSSNACKEVLGLLLAVAAVLLAPAGVITPSSTALQATMYQLLQDTLYFRLADASDIDPVSSIEERSYPADEAASRAALQFRQEVAREAFLVAMKQSSPSNGDNGRSGHEAIVGYICGTLSAAEKLTHESMSRHDPEGDMLCMHSVCVDPMQQRKGIARRMLQGYKVMIQNMLPHIRSMNLICKQNLIELYRGAGFELLGPSEVVHGKDQWYEMRQLLHPEASTVL